MVHVFGQDAIYQQFDIMKYLWFNVLFIQLELFRTADSQYIYNRNKEKLRLLSVGTKFVPFIYA
jgi:hypothetical protein